MVLLLLSLVFLGHKHGEHGDTDGDANAKGHQQRMGHRDPV